MLGALLDYGGIPRSAFAQAWNPTTIQSTVDSNHSRIDSRIPSQKTLFSDAD